jgi:hypothetical protein
MLKPIIELIRKILKYVSKINKKVENPKSFPTEELRRKCKEETQNVRVLDSVYKEVCLESFMEYAEFNTVSEELYVPDEYDCDDFAFEMFVDVKRKFKGCPFGIVLGDGLEGPHAWNCFYDVKGKQLYYFEPQDDTLYLPTIEKEWEIII